ncbi:hypothetical protein QP426_00640 [Pauljensenia sp. UMB1235]|uniref:HK97 gp10 family phage protein n=1 Tax=Actinomycetaceae TaxID=2049 RepID=UPI001898D758|nr:MULTISPECIES: HK97 gp10 family phage protein [Actinomycetaceae]MDK6399570.1 hypothetical protein [Pauljensenia sp. UMB9872]MDK7172183.1 hypothetical protein [Pauljensenia sp. UMB1235]
MGKWVNFNQKYFDEILRSAGVEGLTKKTAERAFEIAYKEAPFRTGEYQGKLELGTKEAKYRRVYQVEGHARHTLRVEARTGHLARSLRKARQS